MKNTNMSRRDFLKKTATGAISLPFICNIGCNGGGGGNDASANADASVTVHTQVDVLLKNGVMIDVKTGNLIPDNMILIKNGRILDIISSSSVTGITAGKTYDLQGNYIIPGLINAHTHMSCPVPFPSLT